MPYKDRPRVLLIDDDIELINMYNLKFQVDGTMEFLTARTPGMGIDIAEHVQPQLILLDLVLPKSDKSFGVLNQDVGFHILELLKSNPRTKKIPVVIFTNLDERTKDNAERAKNIGAFDYWVKANFQPNQVIRRTQEILGLAIGSR